MAAKTRDTYKNQNRAGKWSEYVMSAFKQDEMFVMSQKGTTYHVRYTFKPAISNSTNLEYYEWVDTGELEDLFTIDTLRKLKRIIEEKSKL